MKKIFCLLCLFVISTYADMTNQQLIGQWKITQFLTALPVGELSQTQTDALIGKILVINSQSISLKTSFLQVEERTCPLDDDNSVLVTSTPINYFKNEGYYLDAEEVKSLGLQAPFLAFDSICIPFYTKKNIFKIVFLFGGSFFEAKKISNINS